jgi:hypothetical protein
MMRMIQMIIEIEHDWYDSEDNYHEGVPTTFEISSELVSDWTGEYTEYSATLLYAKYEGTLHNAIYMQATYGNSAIYAAEATAEEYCTEGFTE